MLTAQPIICTPSGRDEQRSERRRDAKQRYQDYQQRAREQAETINRVLDRQVVQVEAYPQVHEVEDGAFVEAIIWVPRERG